MKSQFIYRKDENGAPSGKGTAVKICVFFIFDGIFKVEEHTFAHRVSYISIP